MIGPMLLQKTWVQRAPHLFFCNSITGLLPECWLRYSVFKFWLVILIKSVWRSNSRRFVRLSMNIVPIWTVTMGRVGSQFYTYLWVRSAWIHELVGRFGSGQISDLWPTPVQQWARPGRTLTLTPDSAFHCLFSSGGSRIWQGRRVQSIEKGHRRGRSWRRLWKSRHSLIHFPGISEHYKLYDWVCFYDVSGVDFAGDTISIEHGQESGGCTKLGHSIFSKRAP